MAGLDYLEPYMTHDFRCFLNHLGCPVRIVFSRECQNRAGDVTKLFERLSVDKRAVCGGIPFWAGSKPARSSFVSFVVVRPQMIRKAFGKTSLAIARMPFSSTVSAMPRAAACCSAGRRAQD
jgi:hypothetical protein